MTVARADLVPTVRNPLTAAVPMAATEVQGVKAERVRERPQLPTEQAATVAPATQAVLPVLQRPMRPAVIARPSATVETRWPVATSVARAAAAGQEAPIQAARQAARVLGAVAAARLVPALEVKPIPLDPRPQAEVLKPAIAALVEAVKRAAVGPVVALKVLTAAPVGAVKRAAVGPAAVLKRELTATAAGAATSEISLERRAVPLGSQAAVGEEECPEAEGRVAALAAHRR